MDKFKATMEDIKVWLAAHPKTKQALFWVMLGFVVGFIVGCAAFDAVYWCAKSPPGQGGPFCP